MNRQTAMTDLLPTGEQRSPFMLYVGGLFGMFYVTSVLIIFTLRRRSPIVVALTNPPHGDTCFEYIVTFQTSLKPFSGLSKSAKVCLQLIGEFDNSPVFLLEQNLVIQNILRRGSLDIFVIHTENDLGAIVAIKLDVVSHKPRDAWRPAIISVRKPSSGDCWIARRFDKFEWRHEMNTRINLVNDEYELKRSYRDVLNDYFIFLGVKHLLFAISYTSVKLGTVSSPVMLLLFYYSLSTLFTTTLAVYVFNQDESIPVEDLQYQIAGAEWNCVTLGIVISVALSWLAESILRNICPTADVKSNFVFKGLQELKLYNIRKKYGQPVDTDSDLTMTLTYSSSYNESYSSSSFSGDSDSITRHVDDHHITSNSITRQVNDDHISDDHISGDHINDDHINGDHINDDHINGDHINDDHINGDHINDDHINDDHINDDHITSIENFMVHFVHDVYDHFSQCLHQRSDGKFDRRAVEEMLLNWQIVIKTGMLNAIRDDILAVRNTDISYPAELFLDHETNGPYFQYGKYFKIFWQMIPPISASQYNLFYKDFSQSDLVSASRSSMMSERRKRSVSDVAIPTITLEKYDSTKVIENEYKDEYSLNPSEIFKKYKEGFDHKDILESSRSPNISHSLSDTKSLQSRSREKQIKMGKKDNTHMMPQRQSSYKTLSSKPKSDVKNVLSEKEIKIRKECDNICASLTQSSHKTSLSSLSVGKQQLAVNSHSDLNLTEITNNFSYSHLKPRIKKNCFLLLEIVIKAVLKSCHECLLEINRNEKPYIKVINESVGHVRAVFTSVLQQLEKSIERECKNPGFTQESGTTDVMKETYVNGVVSLIIAKLQMKINMKLETLPPHIPVECDDIVDDSLDNFVEYFVNDIYTFISECLYKRLVDKCVISFNVAKLNHGLELLENEVFIEVNYALLSPNRDDKRGNRILSRFKQLQTTVSLSCQNILTDSSQSDYLCSEGSSQEQISQKISYSGSSQEQISQKISYSEFPLCLESVHSKSGESNASQTHAQLFSDGSMSRTQNSQKTSATKSQSCLKSVHWNPEESEACHTLQQMFSDNSLSPGQISKKVSASRSKSYSGEEQSKTGLTTGQSREYTCSSCTQLTGRIKRDCSFVLEMVVKGVIKSCHVCLLEINRNDTRYIKLISDSVEYVRTVFSNVLQQLRNSVRYEKINTDFTCVVGSSSNQNDFKQTPMDAGCNEKGEMLTHIYVNGVVSWGITKIQMDINLKLDALPSYLLSKHGDSTESFDDFSECFVNEVYEAISQYLYDRLTTRCDITDVEKHLIHWQELLEENVFKEVGSALSRQSTTQDKQEEKPSVSGCNQLMVGVPEIHITAISEDLSEKILAGELDNETVDVSFRVQWEEAPNANSQYHNSKQSDVLRKSPESYDKNAHASSPKSRKKMKSGARVVKTKHSIGKTLGLENAFHKQNEHSPVKEFPSTSQSNSQKQIENIFERNTVLCSNRSNNGTKHDSSSNDCVEKSIPSYSYSEHDYASNNNMPLQSSTKNNASMHKTSGQKEFQPSSSNDRIRQKEFQPSSSNDRIRQKEFQPSSSNDRIRRTPISERCGWSFPMEMKLKIKRHCSFVLETVLKSVLRLCEDSFLEDTSRESLYFRRVSESFSSIENVCSSRLEQLRNSIHDIRHEHLNPQFTHVPGTSSVPADTEGKIDPEMVANMYANGVITMAVEKVQRKINPMLNFQSIQELCENETDNYCDFSVDFVFDIHMRLLEVLDQQLNRNCDSSDVVKLVDHWQEVLETRVFKEVVDALFSDRNARFARTGNTDVSYPSLSESFPVLYSTSVSMCPSQINATQQLLGKKDRAHTDITEIKLLGKKDRAHTDITEIKQFEKDRAQTNIQEFKQFENKDRARTDITEIKMLCKKNRAQTDRQFEKKDRTHTNIPDIKQFEKKDRTHTNIPEIKQFETKDTQTDITEIKLLGKKDRIQTDITEIKQFEKKHRTHTNITEIKQFEKKDRTHTNIPEIKRFETKDTQTDITEIKLLGKKDKAQTDIPEIKQFEKKDRTHTNITEIKRFETKDTQTDITEIKLLGKKDRTHTNIPEIKRFETKDTQTDITEIKLLGKKDKAQTDIPEIKQFEKKDRTHTNITEIKQFETKDTQTDITEIKLLGKKDRTHTNIPEIKQFETKDTQTDITEIKLLGKKDRTHTDITEIKLLGKKDRTHTNIPEIKQFETKDTQTDITEIKLLGKKDKAQTDIPEIKQFEKKDRTHTNITEIKQFEKDRARTDITEIKLLGKKDRTHTDITEIKQFEKKDRTHTNIPEIKQFETKDTQTDITEIKLLGKKDRTHTNIPERKRFETKDTQTDITEIKLLGKKDRTHTNIPEIKQFEKDRARTDITEIKLLGKKDRTHTNIPEIKQFEKDRARTNITEIKLLCKKDTQTDITEIKLLCKKDRTHTDITEIKLLGKKDRPITDIPEIRFPLENKLYDQSEEENLPSISDVTVDDVSEKPLRENSTNTILSEKGNFPKILVDLASSESQIECDSNNRDVYETESDGQYFEYGEKYKIRWKIIPVISGDSESGLNISHRVKQFKTCNSYDLIRHLMMCKGCNWLFCSQIQKKIEEDCVVVLEKVVVLVRAAHDQTNVPHNLHDELASIVSQCVVFFKTISAGVVNWLQDENRDEDLQTKNKDKTKFITEMFMKRVVSSLENKLQSEMTLDKLQSETTLDKFQSEVTLDKFQGEMTLDEFAEQLAEGIINSCEKELKADLKQDAHIQEMCTAAMDEALEELEEDYDVPTNVFLSFLIKQKAICKLVSLGCATLVEEDIPAVVRNTFTYALFGETEEHFRSTDILVCEAWIYRILLRTNQLASFIVDVKTVFNFYSIVDKVRVYVNKEAENIANLSLDRACVTLAGEMFNELAQNVLRHICIPAVLPEFVEIVIQTKMECDLAADGCMSRMEDKISRILTEAVAVCVSQDQVSEQHQHIQDSLSCQTLEKATKSQAEKDKMRKLQSFTKEIEPLTSYIKFIQFHTQKSNRMELTKHWLKTSRKHEELMAINLQNIVDSYYVSKEMPEGYSDQELYITEYALTENLHKYLPAKYKWIVLLVLVALTALLMTYFIKKGSELTSPQAQEWVVLTFLNLLIFSFVFEPLKVLIMNRYRRNWPYF